MLFRFPKLWTAIGLLGTLWAVSFLARSGHGSWVRGATRPGPVRILQFYASAGSVTRGEKALLCYGVENAKSVRISPLVEGVYPSPRHCLEVVPEHTTHYMLLAEGFDGQVATRSFTLAVQSAPGPEVPRPQRVLHFAMADDTPRPTDRSLRAFPLTSP